MKATNTSSWNVRLLLAVALVSASVATARAIDPAKSPSCESGCCESLASPLSKLPYLNRLFKNVGIGYDEGVERIGIDFDFIVATDGKCGDKCSAACVTKCTAKCDTAKCDTAKCDTAKCDHACDKTCGEACVAKC
ncbi:MAG: hypothetical protein KDA59_10825, partial [Planctomycetales bacterium]|nr:hypothetical protein [Planctomycetales bacterium]